MAHDSYQGSRALEPEKVNEINGLGLWRPGGFARERGVGYLQGPLKNPEFSIFQMITL